MRRSLIIIALALVAGASLSTAVAKEKKSKKKAQTAEVVQPVVLTSQQDSVSYATGQMLTLGMMDYVVAQLKLDTAYTAEFVAALKESLNAPETPQNVARNAAYHVAHLVRTNMISRVSEQLGEADIKVDTCLLKRGFVDAVQKDTTIFSADNAAKWQMEYLKEVKDRKVAEFKAIQTDWLKENAIKEGVQKTASGLQYKIVRKGDGPVAQGDEDVTVKYEGRLIDGTIFDSSYQRDPQTITFKPSQVIKGWTEALHMMPEGSEWEIYIPENLAYGAREAGKIPPYSTLIFKLEIVKVAQPEAPKTEVKAQPAAKKANQKGKVAVKK